MTVIVKSNMKLFVKFMILQSWQVIPNIINKRFTLNILIDELLRRLHTDLWACVILQCYYVI
jgi:hypothetical protein